MKVLPTLNIQNGRIRPAEGAVDAQGADPVELACALAHQGCNRIALTDVDAALGSGHNRAVLAQVMRAFRQAHPKCCVQVGGGIRASDQAQFYLDQGATWLLVGTVLHRFPMVMDQLLARFHEHLTANIDARQGEVQASGWTQPAGHRPETLALRLRERGFRRILFTDIPAEPQAEPDFGTARRILGEVRVPVFMGGSLRTRHHLEQAAAVPGLQGVCMDAQFVLDCPGLLSASAQPSCA